MGVETLDYMVFKGCCKLVAVFVRRKFKLEMLQAKELFTTRKERMTHATKAIDLHAFYLCMDLVAVKNSGTTS